MERFKTAKGLRVTTSRHCENLFSGVGQGLLRETNYLFAAYFGVGPGREVYRRIVRVYGYRERVGTKGHIKPIKSSCGRARPPHRVQIVIDDRSTRGYRLVCAGKDAVLVPFTFIHVVGIVVN
jgi:hypothetical protein